MARMKTVSLTTIQDFLVSNGYEDEGSLAAQNSARELAALIRGDDDPAKDRRNIRDDLKVLTSDQVRAWLEEGRSPLISLFANVDGDFNLGTGIRNANWFNQLGVHICGRRKWDRRGAVGTHNYTPVSYHSSVLASITALRESNYRIVAAEITDDAVPLHTYDWAERSAIIYGEEGTGIPREALDMCDDIVYIPGRGSVRSLNVGTTSGIFSYDYHAKRGLLE